MRAITAMCMPSRGLTVKLLEDTVDGSGAAAAGHGDVELVSVCVGHGDELMLVTWSVLCVGVKKLVVVV